MIKVEIHQKYGSSSVTLDSGKLSGDLSILELLKIEAEVREGERIGITPGPYTWNDHLSSDASAFTLLEIMFGTENVEIVEGELLIEGEPDFGVEEPTYIDLLKEHIFE